MLLTLYEIRAENERRDSSGSRFPNAISHSWNRHNQQQKHLHLFSHEHAGSNEEPTAVGWEHALGCTCAKLLDAVRKSESSL